MLKTVTGARNQTAAGQVRTSRKARRDPLQRPDRCQLIRRQGRRDPRAAARNLAHDGLDPIPRAGADRRCSEPHAAYQPRANAVPWAKRPGAAASFEDGIKNSLMANWRVAAGVR